MIQKTKRPVSILLVLLMIVGMFSVLPISAGAAEWTFKLNSNFSGAWNADTDVVSEQPVELNLAAGDYEFQIIANDGTTTFYRGNEQAGSSTETYSQTMYDRGGNAKFHADGGKYTLTYNAGTGVLTINPVYVAEIDGTNYKTLEAAFAAAQDGDTIKVLANCSGNGIKATPEGKFATKGLTVDFDGHTYTVDGTTVGSTGTETQAFQLLKGNKITFKNGTITSAKAKILVQNYSDLTLEGMTLTLDNPNYAYGYTLSNNNGDVVIKDTTINANPAGKFAFDVCRGGGSDSYPSVNVTVTGNSVINGDVEIYARNSDPKDGFSLNLNGGTMNGDIVLDQTAKNVIAATPEKAVITKAADFTQEAPADYKWNDSGVLVPVEYVAQIGSNKYETLEAAFAAAQDGETITVLADCAGNGIVVPQGKFGTGLTVDFNNHTYDVSGTPVGSKGTETIGFQLLKDNKITFKNGTITGDSRITRNNSYLLRMIQNYSDLTLDNMTVSMVGQYYDQITVSTCNGKTVIKDSTISAADFTWLGYDDPADVRAAALAVGTFSSYPSIDVTVEGESTINGDVNVSDDNNKKAFSLTLKGGKLNGNINLDETAKAAIDDTESTANVTKADNFTQAAPEGYKWKDNNDGTSTLVKADLFAGYGLTLQGDIGLIFYLDPAAMGIKADDVESVSVSFTCDKYTGTVTAFTLKDGRIKVAYYVPAAYMASPVHAYSVTINDVTSNETNDYSVQDYALRVIADPSLISNDEDTQNDAVKLMKEMLNYGAKAKAVFQTQMSAPAAAVYKTIPNYTMKNVTVADIDDAIEDDATDMTGITPEAGAKFYGASVIYLSKTTLRMVFAIPDGSGSKLPANAYHGHQGKWYHWVEKTDIPAAELHKQQYFTVGDATFNYSALDYAKAVLNSNMDQANKDLVSALYLYNQAAIAYYAH